jgi:hypothetical protein
MALILTLRERREEGEGEGKTACAASTNAAKWKSFRSLTSGSGGYSWDNLFLIGNF